MAGKSSKKRSSNRNNKNDGKEETTTQLKKFVSSVNFDDDSDDEEDLPFLKDAAPIKPKVSSSIASAKGINNSNPKRDQSRTPTQQQTKNDENHNDAATADLRSAMKRERDPAWIEQKGKGWINARCSDVMSLCFIRTVRFSHCFLFLPREYPSAQQTVDNLSFRSVQGIVDVGNIGWYYREMGSAKNLQFYPAIRVDENKAEAKVLLENKMTKQKTKKTDYIYIQYIGLQANNVNRYDSIPASKWVPIDSAPVPSAASGEQKQAGVSGRNKKSSGKKVTQYDNEGRLQVFLQLIKKNEKKKFHDNPLALKTEELSLRKMWDIVRKQHEEQEQIKRQKLEELEKENGALAAVTTVISQDDTLSPTHFISQLAERRNCDGNVDSDDDSSDDGDDDNNDELGDSWELSGRLKKKGMLKVGDEIEYYAPEGIAGDTRWLRRSTILGVRARDEYPLVLSELTSLPRTHHVRHLPSGYHQSIQLFKLRSGGEQNVAAGLNNLIANCAKTQEQISKSADNFWRKRGANGDGTNAAEVGSDMTKKTKTGTVSDGCGDIESS
jgi:hypothetical protein